MVPKIFLIVIVILLSKGMHRRAKKSSTKATRLYKQKLKAEVRRTKEYVRKYGAPTNSLDAQRYVESRVQRLVRDTTIEALASNVDFVDSLNIPTRFMSASVLSQLRYNRGQSVGMNVAKVAMAMAAVITIELGSNMLVKEAVKLVQMFFGVTTRGAREMVRETRSVKLKPSFSSNSYSRALGS